jgi:polar amino acid transport system substrate-binding protein
MRVLILTGVVAMVAACGAPPTDQITRRPPVSVEQAVPPGMAPDSAPPSAPPRPECQAGRFNARKVSLRPPTALPPPGQMPPGSMMDRIVANKRLVAGVDQNLSRFSARDPATGQLEGFDIDVVKAIALALFGDASKVQLRAVNFSNNFQTLNNGDIDILVDSLTITCERRYGLKVMFSTNYLDASQKVLVKDRSPYRVADDLRGKKVCAPAGTTSIRTIREHNGGILVPVAVPEFDDCLVLLQQNQIDAISSTDTVLLGMRLQDPTLRMLDRALTDEPHGLAMREADEDWVRFVNGVLQQWKDSGGWASSYQRWLGELHPTIPPPPAADYID